MTYRYYITKLKQQVYYNFLSFTSLKRALGYTIQYKMFTSVYTTKAKSGALIDGDRCAKTLRRFNKCIYLLFMQID